MAFPVSRIAGLCHIYGERLERQHPTAGAPAESRSENEDIIMFRIIKLLFYLAVLGLIGLVGYAYLGDMTPRQVQVSVPVTIDVD